MRIKITKELPLEDKYRRLAPIGSEHEVVRIQDDWRSKLYFIELAGTEVGVFQREECEVVEP